MAADVTGGREDGSCHINGHHSEGNHILREIKRTLVVAPPPKIPVRPLETPIFQSAVVKNPTSSPDFGAISPVQRRKTGHTSLRSITFGKAFLHGWSPPFTLVS